MRKSCRVHESKYPKTVLPKNTMDTSKKVLYMAADIGDALLYYLKIIKNNTRINLYFEIGSIKQVGKQD